MVGCIQSSVEKISNGEICRIELEMFLMDGLRVRYFLVCLRVFPLLGRVVDHRPRRDAQTKEARTP